MDPDEKAVYLTFDDGPIPEVTPWVLDLLDKHNIKATFFMVGDNIRKHPEEFRMVVERGHRIGNHTFNHIRGFEYGSKKYLANAEQAQIFMEMGGDISCNVEKAKELLAEAGYPDGFSTTLWCSDTQVMRDSAVVIQEQLRQVGINAEVKTLESGQFQSETGNGAHDMFIMSKTSIDPDSMLRSMYHTEALGPSGNRCFWTTPEVDALIDEASTTTDTEHAMELYAEIQSKVAEAAPLVPMAVEHLNAGMQSNVKGFGLYPGKSHYINGTYFE